MAALAGVSSVALSYAPPDLLLGALISVVALLGVVALSWWGGRAAIRRVSAP